MDGSSLSANSSNTPTTTNLSEFLTNTTVGGTTYLSRDKCLDWKETHHVLYQLANLGFAVAFLVPGTFSSHGPLLRGLVCCGCLFVVMWGGAVTCHVDMVAWHVAFLVINTAHLLYTVYDVYPVQLSNDLELTYHKLFLPLHVPRNVFKQLADLGKIWTLHQGAIFADQGATYSGEHLTVLLVGHLQVLHQGLWLHYIEAGSFVNSIEHESVQESQAGSYQVSYHAVEDCTLLTWQKDLLYGHLEGCPEHKALFRVLLGRDIHQKLTLVQEALMRDPRYLQFVKERKKRLWYIRERGMNGCSRREVEGSRYSDEPEEVLMQNGVSSTAIASSSPLLPGGNISGSQRSCHSNNSCYSGIANNTTALLDQTPPRGHGHVVCDHLEESQQFAQMSIETSL